MLERIFGLKWYNVLYKGSYVSRYTSMREADLAILHRLQKNRKAKKADFSVMVTRRT